MSPNVGNFVHDLVEMAKAMETLPQVQAENERLGSALERALDAVQARESSIVGYKQQIEDLNNKVRSLEVERDDASFRVLEAEDLVNAALNEARVTKTSLELVISKLDPPKPEPDLQPQAVPTPTQDEKNAAHATMYGEGKPTEPNPYPHAGHGYDQPQGSSESNPTSNVISGEPKSDQTSVTSSANSDATSIEEAPKSDTNPTLVSASGDQTQVSASTTASPTDNATSGSDKGPYFSKRYHDMPNYIPRWDWLNGGGTDADYDWRPSNPSYGSTH